jgi:hypothetical protein
VEQNRNDEAVESARKTTLNVKAKNENFKLRLDLKRSRFARELRGAPFP